jgi:hypothetical protein
MKKIALISVFWGDWHTEMFLQGCLPSLLAEKNLPSMAKILNINYLISTNNSNLTKIQNNFYFKELKKFVNIDFHIFEDNLVPNQIGDQWEYSQKSTKHLITQQNLILKKGFDSSIGIIYIHPDCIYSSNTLDYVAQMIIDNVYLLFCPGFRVENNQLFIKYAKERLLKNSITYEFSNHVYNNLNIYHREQFLNSKTKSKYPSTHISRVDNGLLIREFHEKVPLFISSFFKDIEIFNGIDSDYDVSLFLIARKENKKIKYIDNSDHVLIASLVKEDYSLLDRWRVNGNLNDSNIHNKDNFNPYYYHINIIKFYIKSFAIFCSPLQKFSSGHLYKLNINYIDSNNNYIFNKLTYSTVSISIYSIVYLSKFIIKYKNYVIRLFNLSFLIIIRIIKYFIQKLLFVLR